MAKYITALFNSLNGVNHDWNLDTIKYWNYLDETVRSFSTRSGYEVHFWDRKSEYSGLVIKRYFEFSDNIIRPRKIRISCEHGLNDGQRHIYIRTWNAYSERTPVENYFWTKNKERPSNQYVWFLYDFNVPCHSPFELERFIIQWFEINSVKVQL